MEALTKHMQVKGRVENFLQGCRDHLWKIQTMLIKKKVVSSSGLIPELIMVWYSLYHVASHIDPISKTDHGVRLGIIFTLRSYF